METVISLVKYFRLNSLMVPLAKPCTTMAEACTPIFPAVAESKGTKIIKVEYLWKASSLFFNTKEATISIIIPIKSQGNLALVCSRTLSFTSTSWVIPAANW